MSPLSPDWYRIAIRKEMVFGAPLYEGRAAELPDVVVYGTTEDAVRADVRYELDRVRVITGKYGQSLPTTK